MRPFRERFSPRDAGPIVERRVDDNSNEMVKYKISRRLRWFFRLTFLVASAAASIVVAEICIRLLIPVRNVGPSWTVHDPVYSQVLKKNFHGWRKSAEFNVQFNTNSLGFRGPEPVSKSQDVVLFLGDSFTMGYGVTDGEEFPALVAEHLREGSNASNYPVINAAIGGAGNGFWLKFLQREAAQYRPRHVVLQLCVNDFSDNIREKMFELTPKGKLVERTLPDPSHGRKMQVVLEAIPLINRTHIYGLTRQITRHKARHNGSRERPMAALSKRSGEELTLAITEKCFSTCIQQGWKVMFMTQGLLESEVAPFRHLCDECQIELLRIPTKEEMPEKYFKVDAHWTADGHRWVADQVLERLTIQSE